MSMFNLDIFLTLRITSTVSVMQLLSKAVGQDKIPISFVKMTLPVMLPNITVICSTSSVYPDAYEKSKVFPVHNKSVKYELRECGNSID